MDDRQKMRASDADRQEVILRLRTALDEGRLKMDEYLERMGRASEAVTYGDLTSLYEDLPESGTLAHRPPAPASRPARTGTPARTGWFARLPTALRVLWTIWAAAVSVNVVIWVLVCVTTVQLVYPWPVWVAGPAGAVLLAISAAISHGRHDEPGS